MSWWSKTRSWLNSNERPVSAGVALLGFSIAVLSMLVALFQAALLYSQRATPYRTAIYARQLEVTENLVGAANEQHLRIINLHNDCVHRLNGEVGDTADFPELAKDFRTGAYALHLAYGATLAIFPTDVHERARRILMINENLFDNVVAPSATCHGFLTRYRELDGASQSRELYTRTGELVNDVRINMGVEAMSWPAPVREAVSAAPKP